MEFLGARTLQWFYEHSFRSAGKNMQNNAKQIQQKLLCETFASRSCTSAAACRASDCVAVSTLSQYDLRILRELWTCRALYTNLYLYIPVPCTSSYHDIPCQLLSSTAFTCFSDRFKTADIVSFRLQLEAFHSSLVAGSPNGPGVMWHSIAHHMTSGRTHSARPGPYTAYPTNIIDAAKNSKEQTK